jgi:Fe-S cluster assembly iron-binding protein IscA
MLAVTEAAKEKFKEELQKQTTDPEMAIRIVISPSMPNQLRLVLDKEREGDQVLAIEDGIMVLIIGSDLFPALEGMVIDYRETSQGGGFTISELDTGT